MDSKPRTIGMFPMVPTLVLIGCTVVGAIAGALYPYPEWSVGMRVVFGAGMGGFSGSILTFWRMML